MLSMRQKIYIGRYFISIVAALTLLILGSLLNIKSKSNWAQKTGHTGKYIAWQVHLPSTIIYKPGDMKVVKREKETIVYQNTVEEDILNLPWVKQLQRMLSHISTTHNPQVNLVVADEKSIELLLNWMIAALVRLDDPLRNVIVLGIDVGVCELLDNWNIACVFSDPTTFLQPNDKFVRFLPVYWAPQTRLLAARLVNFWGYSFATYDTDAVLLRNPQPLYNAHRGPNIIAGAGDHWPRWARQEWGFAVCLGAMLIRNGPNTGY